MLLATGYTSDTGNQEPDLPTLIFREIEAENVLSDDTEELEHANEGDSEVLSSFRHAHSASRSAAALDDEDRSTVKELSDESLLCWHCRARWCETRQ